MKPNHIIRIIIGFGLAFIPLFNQSQNLSPKELIELTLGSTGASRLEIAERWLLEEPRNPHVYYYLGMLYYDSGTGDDDNSALEKAKQYFEQGIKVRKKYILNYVGLGRVLQLQGMQEEADQYFEKAIHLNKRADPEVNLALGIAYAEAGTRGKRKEAEVFFLKAEDEAPDDRDVNVVLGEFYMEVGAYDYAKPFLRKAIKLEPSYIFGYQQMGKLLAMQSDHDSALYYFDKVITLDSGFAPAFKEKGEVHIRLKQFEDACQSYKRYVELSTDPWAKDRYAKVLYLSGKYQKVIEEYTKISHVPNENIRRRVIGYSYFHLGEFEKAQEWMDVYFDYMNPDHTIPDDYEVYAGIQRAHGEYENAEETYLRAYAMDSSRVYLMKELANMFEQAGGEEKASLYKQRLLELKAVRED